MVVASSGFLRFEVFLFVCFWFFVFLFVCLFQEEAKLP